MLLPLSYVAEEGDIVQKALNLGRYCRDCLPVCSEQIVKVAKDLLAENYPPRKRIPLCSLVRGSRRVPRGRPPENAKPYRWALVELAATGEFTKAYSKGSAGMEELLADNEFVAALEEAYELVSAFGPEDVKLPDFHDAEYGKSCIKLACKGLKALCKELLPPTVPAAKASLPFHSLCAAPYTTA